jgi:anaerobic dimethyl sulfoxide reductase subunit B (iron-sulfur subunit)
MQMVFYFNRSRCTGCYACVVTCKDWHDIPPGPVFLRRVIVTEEGRYPEVTVSFLSTACHHCAHPACVPACPAGAITKRETDGIVVVDRELCLGGEQCARVCLEACPYEAPQFGEEPDARMQKCDLCSGRWQEGRKPVCVEACPMRALDAGSQEEMEAKYGLGKETAGFIVSGR